jgi:AraC-like DNA-binding protein
MLSFIQQKPHPLLRNYIQGYWTVVGDQTRELLTLAPDGYPEICFVLQGSLRTLSFENNSLWTAHTNGCLMGQATTQIVFEMAPMSRIVYVKLQPWTPYTLFRIPGWQFNDQAVGLETIASGLAFDQLKAGLLQNSLDDIPPATILDRFFLAVINPLEHQNPFLRFAVQQIHDSIGTISINRLTNQIHASRRYIEKLFTQQIGMSPKRYAQIIRVKKASMCLLDPRFKGNIGAIAHSLDYYDQSHFLKDFKLVMNQTPSAFMNTPLNFSEPDVLNYLDQWDYS